MQPLRSLFSFFCTISKECLRALLIFPLAMRILCCGFAPFYNFNSLATVEAIFLKLIEVPAMRLKRTPLRERRGSLQTSISHCTWFASEGLPWQHNNRKLSRCSYSQSLDSKTFLISSIISCGSIELVVFMLHVNRRERGLSPWLVSFIDLQHQTAVVWIVTRGKYQQTTNFKRQLKQTG